MNQNVQEIEKEYITPLARVYILPKNPYLFPPPLWLTLISSLFFATFFRDIFSTHVCGAVSFITAQPMWCSMTSLGWYTYLLIKVGGVIMWGGIGNNKPHLLSTLNSFNITITKKQWLSSYSNKAKWIMKIANNNKTNTYSTSLCLLFIRWGPFKGVFCF